MSIGNVVLFIVGGIFGIAYISLFIIVGRL